LCIVFIIIDWFLENIRDVFEDAMVEAKAKARSFRIKATYAYEILHD